MQYDQQTGTWRASATDLANHARCEHLTQRARERARAIALGTEAATASTSLAITKGLEHEQRMVAERRAQVEARGGRFVDLGEVDVERRFTALEVAMRDGVELIAQAPLRDGSIFGYADLIERVDNGDSPGGTLTTMHRYEPVEVKLAASVRPAALLQACIYAAALERLQGDLPRQVHVVTGDGSTHDFDTVHYVEYVRAARGRFLDALALDLEQELERVPDPVPHCDACEFLATCRARWNEVDHLSLVAGIRSDQRAKLAGVGITSLTQLATSTVERVASIGPRTLAGLRSQASLQLESRTRPPHDPALRYRSPDEHPTPAGRGFALLPEPDDEDMFFDFEGYPYHERGALEYLWGWTSADPDAPTRARFDYLWADTPAEEGAAFTRFLDEVHARRERSPGMHVYHYAPYEITALRRLAHEHHHEQDRLDELLRAGTFVDLYAVVRQALQIGTHSYSIKQLEPLYGVDRTNDELADGGSSIEVYEQYLATRDPQIRQTILDYNEVDCASTLYLRNWLLVQRARAAEQGIIWPSLPKPEPDAATDGEPTADGEQDAADAVYPTQALGDRLEALAADPSHAPEVRSAARLLSGMPGWARRVEREFFGDLHGRKHDRDDDDYVREPTALGALTLVDEVTQAKGTVDRTYEYPAQVTLLKEQQQAIDPTSVLTVGSIRALDLQACRVTIRTTAKQQERYELQARAAGLPDRPIPSALVGWTDYRTQLLEASAIDAAEWLLAQLDAGRDPFDVHGPYASALGLLAGLDTRTSHGAGPEALAEAPTVDGLADLVQRSPGSHVIVQGPPGTGKTWVSARLIVELVRRGCSVGISSNARAAIENVLHELDALRREHADAGTPLRLRAAYALATGEKAPGRLDFGSDWIERPRRTRDATDLLRAGDVQVLAGTAWQFAGDARVDVMLIDEAGQVSLLHGTAMATAARTTVLVGDPQQLPQPSDAAHPHGCDASLLDHSFGGAEVLPTDRAVLLPVTYRMHPDVCSYVSDHFYAGRLGAHPSTTAHRVELPGLPQTGVHLLPVEHRGNRSSSHEEVAAIDELVRDLLARGRVVAREGDPERAVRAGDILVVAPYNAQRALLEAALPEGVRVGTVDRFQGKQAAISILSLTASSRDDLPRGLGFLLDPHRMNVAVSRARALALVVASPALLATSAESIAEMRMLNDLAWIAHRSVR